MKPFPSLLKTGLRLLLFSLGLSMCQIASAAVGVTISPAVITNDYLGKITITVSGLTPGKTIRMEKYGDLNTNGVINAPENKYLWRSFTVTDGQLPLLAGCTNLNVVGDMDGAANGEVRAELFYPGTDATLDRFAIKYLFRLSDTNVVPAFTPITNSFEVRQKVYPQGVTGKVVASGTGFPLTNAVVVVVRMNAPGGYGAVADSGGNFTVYTEPGDYALITAYTNTILAAPVTVSPNVFTSQNYTSTPAPFTISGKISDSSNGAGLPGVFVLGQGSGGFTLGFTDNNGDYGISVPSGEWEVGPNSSSLAQLGYVGLSDAVETNVIGNVSGLDFALPKATALIYGRLVDNFGNPVSTIDFYAENPPSYSYEPDGRSFFPNGGYSIGVIAGDWEIQPAEDTLGLEGFVGPGSSTSVSIANGQCIQVNFTVLRATNRITGYVKDTGNNPIADLDVSANTTVNGTNYHAQVNTDNTGFYSLNVANGSWTVMLHCYDDDGLISLGYCCVNNQNVNISGADGVADFIAASAGQVAITTASPLPAGAVDEFYQVALAASSCQMPFNWALSPGSAALPSGLNLDSNGILSGFPDTAGSNYFSVRMTDNGAHTADKGFSLVITAPTPDVLRYYLTKERDFFQTDPSTLVPDTFYGPFNAYLGIVQSALGGVSIANVTLPTSVVKGFPSGNSAIELRIREPFANQAAFDAAYPSGNYAFAISTVSNGNQFPVLNLPPFTYPNAPRVSNYAAAQTINPNSPFLLQWDPFSGGTTNQTIWFLIFDENGNPVFSTPPPQTEPAAALKGTATAANIPAGTLQFGRTYLGVVVFFKGISTNSTGYPGAFGVTFAAAETAFALTTLSASPSLGQAERVSATQFGFTLSGVPGSSYTVLTTTNLSVPLSNWPTLLVTNLSTGSAFILDNQATNQQRFYRARLGP